MIVDCVKCGALVEAVRVGGYWDADPNEQPANQYSLHRCPKCDSPFLIHRDETDDDTTLYPATTRINPSLPRPIQDAFTEAQACFRTKAYTATAIMCRKTLEGISSAHQVKSRDLVSALRQLKEQGVIEQRLFEWADALRITGNEAAHDVNSTVTASDARDILEFTHALLEYVFTFRDRFEAFKKRREERKAT